MCRGQESRCCCGRGRDRRCCRFRCCFCCRLLSVVVAVVVFPHRLSVSSCCLVSPLSWAKEERYDITICSLARKCGEFVDRWGQRRACVLGGVFRWPHKYGYDAYGRFFPGKFSLPSACCLFFICTQGVGLILRYIGASLRAGLRFTRTGRREKIGLYYIFMPKRVRYTTGDVFIYIMLFRGWPYLAVCTRSILVAFNFRQGQIRVHSSGLARSMLCQTTHQVSIHVVCLSFCHSLHLECLALADVACHPTPHPVYFKVPPSRSILFLSCVRQWRAMWCVTDGGLECSVCFVSWMFSGRLDEFVIPCRWMRHLDVRSLQNSSSARGGTA